MYSETLHHQHIQGGRRGYLVAHPWHAVSWCGRITIKKKELELCKADKEGPPKRASATHPVQVPRGSDCLAREQVAATLSPTVATHVAPTRKSRGLQGRRKESFEPC